MSDENLKLFENENNLIDSEINKIDDLYLEIKSHFDTVKNSRSAGTLTFIEKQTANLVNLKNAKLGMIREKINIKKISSDLDYKEKQLAAKEKENNESLPPELFNQLQDLINSNRAEIPGPNDHDPLMDIADKRMEDEIDKLLDMSLEDDDSPLLKVKKEIETIKTELFCDINGIVWSLEPDGLKEYKKLDNYQYHDDIKAIEDLNDGKFYNLITNE